MKQFRQIYYHKMLFETLTQYFSVNASGKLSILYRYLLSCLTVLQPTFEDLDKYRIARKLIAGCAYQNGHLTNLLNYFYDDILKRIYITQAQGFSLYINTSNSAITFSDYDFFPTGNDAVLITDMVFATTNNDAYAFFTDAIIHVPASIYASSLSAITSTIEQIKIQGLVYQIQQI